MSQPSQPSQMIINFYSEDRLVKTGIYPANMMASDLIEIQNEVKQTYPDAMMRIRFI